MSPRATLPVEDNGGMSVDQIHLLVTQSNIEQSNLWGSRMEDFTDRVNAKLDEHTERVDDKIEKKMASVDLRFDAQDRKIDTILVKIEASVTQQHAWHDEDLNYRADTKASVVAVQLRQDDINTKLNVIQWFVMFCRGFVKTGDLAVTVFERWQKIAVAITAIFSTILVVWQAFRTNGMLDTFKHWLKLHSH